MLLCASVPLSGCKSYGPVGSPDFDPTYSRTLEKNEQLMFAAQTELIDGTYMEGEEEAFPSYNGMMLLTSQRILFVRWNGIQLRYEPLIWAGYADIAQVKMHNNILLQYISYVATDGHKYTYMLGKNNVDQAYAILMACIQARHKIPDSTGIPI